MPEDPKRIKEIFLAASEQPDQAGRAAYLDEACGGDAALRARVEALLRSHDAAGSFLNTPIAVMPDVGCRETRSPDPVPESACDDGISGSDADSWLQNYLAPATRSDSFGRLGHYEVLQVLGRGSFGIVLRALDDVLQRVVAVKMMFPHLASTSPARKRFLREARSSAAVRHENVVHVYEVAEQPLPYLVMEFIPGETLQQKLDRSGPLEVCEVLRIGRQIAEGLAAAHANDLIHRDIKPANILLEGGSQKVKITDFGLARAADDASISHSGVIAGTPMFMAPEQALGHQIDRRADLFSLGSVLYQMVSGRPPFRAPSTLAVLKRVVEESPRPIPQIVPETPPWLCDIISKLHAKNPDDRYQSARELADVLADCERQVTTGHELRSYSGSHSGKSFGRQWKRKKTFIITGAALLILAASWVLHLRREGAELAILPDHQVRGELEILPEKGLVSVIVLKNDEGVIDGNKLLPRVTDWLDMTNPHTLAVPPGKYQLNVGTWPAGTSVREWEVTTSGPSGKSQLWVPVVNSSAIITVDSEERVTLRAKIFVTSEK